MARVLIVDDVEIGSGCVVGVDSLVAAKLTSNMVSFGTP